MEVTFMFGWGYECAGFWWILPIFMFIMIIACIFMMRRFCMSGWSFSGRKTQKLSTESAEDILKRRYALGEINRKEYVEMEETISQNKRRQP
jgi:uncharacterized membrane protein